MFGRSGPGRVRAGRRPIRAGDSRSGNIEHEVVPQAFAAAFGNAVESTSAFTSAPARLQQVFLGSELPVARTLRGLALRQDQNVSGVFRGYPIDLQIDVGYTTLTPATITTTFASNFDSGPPITVLPQRTVVLPDMNPIPNPVPSSFLVEIPFVNPFPYQPQAGRNLLVQVTQRGNGAGDQPFVYMLDAATNTTTSRLVSTPTATTGTVSHNAGLVMAFSYDGSSSAVPLLTSTGEPVLANTFSVDVSQARPNAPALLLIGASNQSWNGIPLPLPLAAAGAPGCSLLAAGDTIVAVATDGSGRAAFTFAVPPDPTLLGARLFNQYAVFDPGANAMGLVWTRGGEGLIGSF